MTELHEGDYVRVALAARGPWSDDPHPLAGRLVRVEMFWPARDQPYSVAYVSWGAPHAVSVKLADLEAAERAP